MEVTFDLPDEVVTQLQPFADKLPQILELGLRELNAIAQEGFSGMAEVLEFLANLPTAEAIIALRPFESLQAQTSASRHPNRSKVKLWSDFTLFGETLLDQTEMLGQIQSHIHLFRREKTNWDPAFHLYSGLAFTKG
jgi:hypothetical protein